MYAQYCDGIRGYEVLTSLLSFEMKLTNNASICYLSLKVKLSAVFFDFFCLWGSGRKDFDDLGLFAEHLVDKYRICFNNSGREAFLMELLYATLYTYPIMR